MGGGNKKGYKLVTQAECGGSSSIFCMFKSFHNKLKFLD